MKNVLSGIILTSLVLLAITLKAEIQLPAIFGSNMVLQQQTAASLWGSATPEATVEVNTSWDNGRYTIQAGPEGDWEVKIKTPGAGGPFNIRISDGQELTLQNVMIGEVWVCSGQSNMEMPMKGYRNQPILGANEAIATSENNEIRLFTVDRAKSLEPGKDFTGSWLECTPGNVAGFSATAYFFGRMLHEALDVPVGLISSNWGGTRIEPWMSEGGVRQFDWVDLPDKNMEGDFSQQTPTVLFNAMIAPMVGYGIKGAIWYQGESNRNEPDKYEQLLPGLAENWRKEWDTGEFPFYYAQIAPYDYGERGLNSAFIREAMLNASDGPNMGMACLMDAGEKNCIHPANKEVAGERLAFLALAKTYKKDGIACRGPVLKEMKVDGSLVNLTFNHAEQGLTTFGKPLKNFKIAGENKRFHQAEAVITRNGITLSSPYVSKPVAVRYAFEDFVVGELYNIAGLPASSFRTDNWEAEE